MGENMKCPKCGSKMEKIDLRFVTIGPYKYAYVCKECK